MRALVEKMLLLARLESAVSVPRVVDVRAVADEAVATMRARFPDRAIDVAGEGAATIVDPDDLYAAVHNLVENALNYAASPVRVEAARDGSAARITVRDRGPGIAAADRAKIFERFYRGAVDGVAGSGLGLSIVARVAERWNGTVTLDSRPGDGAAFTLRFPLAEEVPA